MMIIPATYRFSAHCSKRFAWQVRKLTVFLFIKLDRVIVTQVGFSVISPWSLPRFLSNYKKALLRWLLHLHSNFQLIPPRGLDYPAGVTDRRPYFTQIIGHNSANVHQIPTKVGIKIRLNVLFKGAKFQSDRCTFVFYGEIFEVWEMKKKTKKLKRKFVRWYLGAIFFKFGM